MSPTLSKTQSLPLLIESTSWCHHINCDGFGGATLGSRSNIWSDIKWGWHFLQECNGTKGTKLAGWNWWIALDAVLTAFCLRNLPFEQAIYVLAKDDSYIIVLIFTDNLLYLYRESSTFHYLLVHMSISSSIWDSHLHSYVLTLYVRLYWIWKLLVFTLLYVGGTYARLVLSWHQNIFHMIAVLIVFHAANG